MERFVNARIISTTENVINHKIENEDIIGILELDTENGTATFNGSGYFIFFEMLIGIGVESQGHTTFITLFEVNENMWLFEDISEV